MLQPSTCQGQPDAPEPRVRPFCLSFQVAFSKRCIAPSSSSVRVAFHEFHEAISRTRCPSHHNLCRSSLIWDTSGCGSLLRILCRHAAQCMSYCNALHKVRSRRRRLVERFICARHVPGCIFLVRNVDIMLKGCLKAYYLLFFRMEDEMWPTEVERATKSFSACRETK